jgi:hypothetical protein
MSKLLVFSVLLGFTAAGCASKKVKDLDKYPQCYHQNIKLSQACVDKNEAGDATTALQLENAAYPGQYQ